VLKSEFRFWTILLAAPRPPELLHSITAPPFYCPLGEPRRWPGSFSFHFRHLPLTYVLCAGTRPEPPPTTAPSSLVETPPNASELRPSSSLHRSGDHLEAKPCSAGAPHRLDAHGENRIPVGVSTSYRRPRRTVRRPRARHGPSVSCATLSRAQPVLGQPRFWQAVWPVEPGRGSQVSAQWRISN
jgi:hypothetical protein